MTLNTLTLLPLDLDSFETLASWIPDRRAQAIWSANTFPFPLNQDDFQDHLTLCHSDAPHREFMKAVDADGRMVGVFSLKRIDSLGRTGHLSMIIISPEIRGQGMGTAMVKAAIARGFDVKKFRRIQLYVFDFNTSAKICYERCGLMSEGPTGEPLAYKNEAWCIEVMAKGRPQ